MLDAQRLMGPKVVYFLSEKFLSLLRQTILLCRKRLIIIRSITGNQNREIGEELSCGGKFSRTSHRNPLAKIYKARQGPKTEKIKNHVQFT